jgi:hypothetical protein
MAVTRRVLTLTIVLVGAAVPAAAQTLPDHAVFDGVLSAYVRDGLVDYEALAANRIELDLYLERLARTSPTDVERSSRDARLAFWINAYNACALRLVIDHYPIEKRGGVAAITNKLAGVPANSIRQIPDTWTAQFCRVAQRDRSLDGIEHGIIRPLGEPRIHFAVNCASRSCPELAQEAYRAERLEEQLDAAVRRFVEDQQQYALERSDPPVLRVNKILDWYKEDFGGTGGVVEFLRRYAPALDRPLLQSGKIRVEYFDYDWTLNDTAVFGTKP